MLEIRETATFTTWLTELRDSTARAIIAARVQRLTRGLEGDVRSVGRGIDEMRIHYGPGYRVYFVRQDPELIILLCAGSKGTQRRDIARARRLRHELGDQC